jgi:hypothetical protein
LFVGPVLLAIAQGFALRRYWSRALQWGLATLVGGYLALGVFMGLLIANSLTLSWLWLVIGGSVLGLVQAFVFKGRSRYWGWWPLVSGMSLLIGVSWFMRAAMNTAVYGTQRSAVIWLVLAALTGLIGGALKGLALTWFLQQSPTLPTSKS